MLQKIREEKINTFSSLSTSMSPSELNTVSNTTIKILPGERATCPILNFQKFLREKMPFAFLKNMTQCEKRSQHRFFRA